jgi:phosphoribosylanthranilate isomerase
MFLKVCGMRDAENIRQVAALGPAMMGFIFVSKSPRFAGEILDQDVLDELPHEIQKVAVFVDPTVEEVGEILSRYSMDHLQLHGDETADLINELQGFGKPIIKVMPGNRPWDQEYMTAIEPLIAYWLIDTRTDLHGGTGKVFDRSVLQNYNFKKPVILSGGLNADEVAQIINENHPVVAGVDINSKVEDSPGVKNCDKINEVITCLN